MCFLRLFLPCPFSVPALSLSLPFLCPCLFSVPAFSLPLPFLCPCLTTSALPPLIPTPHLGSAALLHTPAPSSPGGGWVGGLYPVQPHHAVLSPRLPPPPALAPRPACLAAHPPPRNGPRAVPKRVRVFLSLSLSPSLPPSLSSLSLTLTLTLSHSHSLSLLSLCVSSRLCVSARVPARVRCCASACLRARARAWVCVWAAHRPAELLQAQGADPVPETATAPPRPVSGACIDPSKDSHTSRREAGRRAEGGASGSIRYSGAATRSDSERLGAEVTHATHGVKPLRVASTGDRPGPASPNRLPSHGQSRSGPAPGASSISETRPARRGRRGRP